MIVAKGDVIDRQRLWMAYELFETTSPSVPILATLDATRRDHALHGERLWGDVLDLAECLRRKLSAMTPLRVLGREHLPAYSDLDSSKVLIDMSALSVSGYAVDDWLYKHHRISVGLSDARHLLLVLSLGTTRSDVRKFVRAMRDLLKQLACDPGLLPACTGTPGISTLSVEMAVEGTTALNGPAETIPYEDAAGRVAAEMIAPAPPGVPRLVPGQLITAAHVRWLVTNRDAGAFIMDPVDPSGASIRVMRSQ